MKYLWLMGVLFLFLLQIRLFSLGYEDYFNKSSIYYRPKHRVKTKKNKEYKKVDKEIKSKLSQTGVLKVGCVNIAALCIIHPLSDYYYPLEKKFVKPYSSNTLSGREMEFKKRMEEYKRKVQVAKEKIKKLKEKIKMMEVRREKLKEKLASKIRLKRTTMIYEMGKLPPEKRASYRKKVERMLKRMENKVFQEVEKINKAILRESKKYEKYKVIVNSTFYAEKDEERKLVNQIMEDVYTVSRDVARSYGITYLFNSSNFFMKGVKKEGDQYQLLFKEKYDYQMFRSIPSYMLGIGKNKKDYYYYKLSHQPTYIGPFWESPGLRNLMIMGEVDITPTVIKKIFQKYKKTDKEIEDAIQAYKMIKGKF